jgi:tRNA threonylcarbamoyladenosine biosynthesis protein TsaE
MEEFYQGNPPIKLTITTHSPDETFGLGQALGEIVSKGTVVAMTGVLGSGKTLFVQGVARGLEVPETYYITSPSYTLVNEYPGRYRLYHADLYRLTQQDDIESTGLYDMLHKEGVVVIEWAERMVREDLADHVVVHFELRQESVREIWLRGYGQRCNNLLRELENISKLNFLKI